MKYYTMKVGFTGTIVSDASEEPRIGKYFSTNLEWIGFQDL